MIDDLTIDAEWRCDMKWARLTPHLPDLRDKRVLDVGASNGWFLWQLAARGAAAFGIDPNPRAFLQFLILKRLTDGALPPFLLPLYFDDVPPLAVFDCVLSMGVLYHHRAPLFHLQQLRRTLAPNGVLFLETLYVEDIQDVQSDVHTVYMPEDRYFGMKNVWLIPSIAVLTRWLKRSGFTTIRVLDTGTTTTEEQRTTEWSSPVSLGDFAADDLPKRVIVSAQK